MTSIISRWYLPLQARTAADNTIETTGAGDTFMAVALYYAVTKGLDNLDKGILAEALRTASLAASLITTRKGALAVMPDPEEIREYGAGR